MTEQERAILGAVAEVVNDRMARLRRDMQQAPVQAPHVTNQLDLTPVAQALDRFAESPPHVAVTNEVPAASVVVEVDMAPVAAALDRMTTALVELVRAAAERPPPTVEFSPVVKVPETNVTVEAPSVTVEAPKHERRTMTIKHSDGTQSTITEN